MGRMKKTVGEASNLVLRRSKRLNSQFYPAQVRTRVVEHLNLVDDDVEDQYPKKDTTFARITKQENRCPKKRTTIAQVTETVLEHLNLDQNANEEDRYPKKNTTLAQITEPVSEHLDLDENGKDKDSEIGTALGKSMGEDPEKQPQVEEVIDLGVANEENAEVEAKYTVQSDDEGKFNNTSARSSGSPPHDLSYKTLYIKAQKKIEVLMEEKFALLQELQFKSGQIAAFEKMKDMFATPREVIVVPGLTNATTSTLTAQGRLQDRVVQSPAVDNVEDRNAAPKPKKRRKWRRY